MTFDIVHHLDPTHRFTSRADAYAQHRPDYPREIISALQQIIPINARTIIADIGSGTGIFTKLLLETGSIVHAVEPNEAMRSKAEISLGRYPNFTSVDGRAETTTLVNQSVDLITVAQAFHWFDPEKSLKEFARILKLTGLVSLIWNARVRTGDPLAEAYEKLLLRFCPEYIPEQHMEFEEARLRDALGPIHYTKISFPHMQDLDLEGFKGRLLSTSYTPTLDQSSFQSMITTLESIFQQFQRSGFVTIRYETKMYYFRLGS